VSHLEQSINRLERQVDWKRQVDLHIDMILVKGLPSGENLQPVKGIEHQ